jgi:hypothetical protein
MSPGTDLCHCSTWRVVLCRFSYVAGKRL